MLQSHSFYQIKPTTDVPTRPVGEPLIICFSFQKIRCQRKEPCRLFSVRKNVSRPSADEVSMSSLCQCPKKSRCPKHHLDVGVIPGKVYTDTTVRTYSGYCM